MSVLKNCLVVAALCCVNAVYGEPPQRPEAQLRFDEATRDKVADVPLSVLAADSAGVLPFACKLNRRRVSEARAYDAVTLWNVRRVEIKERRMRLSDTMRREKVKLLKFFIERDRPRRVRPHQFGNVAGCLFCGEGLSGYTLRSDYDSIRRAGGELTLFQVPRELWHGVPPGAAYVLDGKPVPGWVFRLFDGIVLQTLDVYTGAEASVRYGAECPALVAGDTYPDRVPLVIFNGRRSTIAAWLELCVADAFNMAAAVPLRYYYMLPVEAVQLYGREGIHGAVCIDLAE